MWRIKKLTEEFGVLIETYWNVNTERLRTFKTGQLVLIETYWNVNLEKRRTKMLR